MRGGDGNLQLRGGSRDARQLNETLLVAIVSTHFVPNSWQEQYGTGQVAATLAYQAGVVTGSWKQESFLE